MKINVGSGLGIALKIAVVIILLLLLLIPMSLVNSILKEREKLARETTEEIIAGVGGPFHIIGPMFVRPYTENVETVDKNDLKRVYTKQSNFYVLPDFVEMNGELETDYRQRGIFRTSVYKMTLSINGQFTYPESDIYPDAVEVPRLVVGIPFMGGLRELSPLQWGSESIDFSPDSGATVLGPGMVALSLPEGRPGQSLPFSWTMELDGGGSVAIIPLGRDSTVVLSGDWPAPSFKGTFLPNDREWSKDGFHARWRIPELSRPIPYNGSEDQLKDLIPNWSSNANKESKNLKIRRVQNDPAPNSLIVELMDPVNAYTQFERSLKYRLLFLIIPFIVFFIFEVKGNMRIHIVQYLLVGAVAVIFYLLLLALTEHFGFNAAYVLSALGTGMLLCFYQASVTQSSLAWKVIPPIMAAIYFWLWSTLQSEDYALLIGSAGLFVILTAVMVLTRKVDYWSVGIRE